MNIRDFKNKKIVILGFGREGRDTLCFLQKLFPKKIIGIADQTLPVFDGSQQRVVWHLGKDYLKALKRYEVIVKSPGVPWRIITPFLVERHIVTSQTEIFFNECPGTIVGITGTKGKSTTSALIYEVLRAGGFKANLIGNIEKPVLHFLETAHPKDIFVYELSSFQLTNLSVSPHIAVLLNIYPEHIDYYGGNFKAYTKAKANVTVHQTAEDFLIFNSEDPLVSKIAKDSKAQKLPYVRVLSVTSNRWVASTEPARIIGELFGIAKKNIEKALTSFQPLAHRLEKVGEFNRIIFYNDSLATIPEATIEALNTLGPAVHTLVAGGHDRGISFEKLGQRLQRSSVKTLVLFPNTGQKILQSLVARPGLLIRFVKDMKEAVSLCYAHTPKGKICLLSPASASFNMFKDYKERGKQFRYWVKKLAHENKA